MTGSWIDDGSNSIESEGVIVTCNGTEAGTPSNSLFKGFELSPGGGQAYWTINFVEVGESPFVGLTTEARFGKGWAINGFMYGGPGNVSNGSGGLLFGFGESIKTGDTVGILADSGANHLRIYYFHNGKPLGIAFDLSKPESSPLYPVISFSGKTKAVVNRVSEIPTEKDRKGCFDSNSIVGNWGLESSSLKAARSDVTLEIKGKGDIYRGSLHIINHIGIELVKSADGWTVTVGLSTKMGGSPDHMAFESGLISLIRNTKSVELEDGKMVYRDEVEEANQPIVWTRKSKEFKPATEFP